MKQDNILVLDLGSSENTTIARWIRDLGVYSEIHPHDLTAQNIEQLKTVKGIILNGGKNNIIDGEAIDVLDEIYSLNIPVISVNHPSTKALEVLEQWPSEEETKAVLKDFVFHTCKAEANWNMKNFIDDQVALIRKQIGDKKVLLALSGGVDSSVVAALLIKAIGKQLVCVHVNHGLMRKNESEGVIQMFEKDLEENLIYVDASERFLGKLKGVDGARRET